MQKITFEDLPSTNTPINASNLNQIQDNVEDAMEWQTLATNVTPNTSVNLPSSYNEIQVEINVNTSSTATANFITLILSKAQIDTITGSNYKNFRTGASYSSSFYFGVTVRAYATYISLTEVYNSGSLVNDYSTMNVYYK